ncbi:MAG TPA: response regulator [Smithella sp.]|nr:response regulator [Smithella sp.]
MKQRILIVDDEKAILMAFKKLLSSGNVDVDTAETIDETENLLKENIYNVAMVDLRLTGVTGEEGLVIIKYIKEFYPRTEVILVTGYGSSCVMEKARTMGAAFYFEKPVSVQTLKDALKSLGVG